MRSSVCTNKPTAAAEHLLSKLEIDKYFECVIGGDSLPTQKPDPKVLQHTLDLLEARPECAVMVGDHRNDALVAAGLGVPFIFATYGYGKKEDIDEPIAATLTRFDQLPAIIESLPIAFNSDHEMTSGPAPRARFLEGLVGPRCSGRSRMGSAD